MDRQGDDLAGSALAVLVGLPLDLPDEQRGLPLGLVLDGCDQLGLGLVSGEAGRALQDCPTLVLDVAQFRGPAVDLGLELNEVSGLLLQRPGLRIQALFALSRPQLPPLEILTLCGEIGPGRPRFCLGARSQLLGKLGRLPSTLPDSLSFGRGLGDELVGDGAGLIPNVIGLMLRVEQGCTG